MDAVLRRHKEMIPECTTKDRIAIGRRCHSGCLYEDVVTAAARSCCFMICLHNNKVLNVNNSAFVCLLIASQINRKAADSVVKSAAKVVVIFNISK
jgi:hypothetical protein